MQTTRHVDQRSRPPYLTLSLTRRAFAGLAAATALATHAGRSATQEETVTTAMERAPQPHPIQINGAELTYVEQGDGETIVVVHGALGDYRSWLDLFAPFAARYRTITYSRRGHYPNAWPADYARSDPEVHAADLAALIGALDTGPVHLFGHSYGGVISLVLASRQPDLVRTLLLGEPPLFNWLDTTPEDRALAADFIDNALEPAHRAFETGDLEAGVRVFLDSAIGEGAFDQIPPPVQAAMLDNAREMRVHVGTPPEMLYSSLSREDVEQLHIPALVLDGELSPPILARVNDELARSLPNAERVTIPGVSHDLWNPPVFTETVLGFLAKH